VLLVVVWAASGPFFDWNETWQLLINTSTTILTFLMIFLLQATQNRDAEAVQLKLDELIRAIDRASNSMLSVEELDEAELARLKRRYEALARRESPVADPEPVAAVVDSSGAPT
jgi:low affinity Fe/Cu permease